VERMKERGAEFIIGVDFPRPEYDPNADLSLLDVMMESNRYVNVRYNDINRALCDVLIIPALGSISSTDYYLADSIVKLGEAAARLQFDRLKFLADSLGVEQRSFENPLPTERNVTEIRIEGLPKEERAILQHALSMDFRGPIQSSEYLAVARNLYGSGDFEQVAYRVTPDTINKGHSYDLHLTPKAAPASLNTALNYTTDFGAAILLNYTHRNLWLPGFRLLADGVVSASPSASLKYFSVLGPEILPYGEISYFRYSQPLYVEGNSVSKYSYQTFFARLFGQSNLNVNTVAGGGLEYQRTDLFGDAFNLLELDAVGFNMLNVKVYYRSSKRRNAYFAQKGSSFEVELSANADLEEGFFTNPYYVYKIQFSDDLQLAKKWNMRYTLRSGNSLNRNLPSPIAFYSGGFGQNYHANIHSFFGYNRMELRSDGLHSALMELHYQFLPGQYLKLLGNVGVGTNIVNFETFDFETQYIDGFGAGYAFDSPIGPLQIFGSYGTQTQKWQFYLYMGYWF
jgi:NTE family protein